MSPVIDLHCDTLCYLSKTKESLKDNQAMVSFEKLKQSNYFLQDFACFVKYNEHPYLRVNELISIYKKELSQNKDVVEVLDKKDLNQKGLKVMLSIEEGGALEGNIERLEEFYLKGVRLITLTWNFKNEIASPNDVIHNIPNTKEGLTAFGKQLVHKMNNLGVIIDVSHLSDAGFYDVIKESNKPIMASHSNSRFICNHVRNLTDDMILKIKDNGGVMGINFCHDFVISENRVATTKDLVKHINHVKEVAGIDVIALGSDFDGISNENIEIKNASMMNLLYNELRTSGYSQLEIDKIFYLNALRVIKSNLK